MKFSLGSIILLIIFNSCGNNSNQTNTPAKIIEPNAAAISDKDLKLARFDLLENLLQNDNWLLLNGNDSSYLYCSRLGKAYFKTYAYKIVKGDSVNNEISEIKLLTDTITWVLPQKSIAVYLNNISVNEAVWADRENLNFYTFQRVDSNHIHLKYPDGSFRNLVRTLTLSSFLVRSKYDYLHGTRLAFENIK